MRRAALPLIALALVLAGCGGGEEVRALPETVEGEVTQAEVGEGDPARGKTVFAAQGCNSCHAFTPAGSTAKIGPNLDELEQGAEEADQELEEYARQSIVNPNAHVREGYQEGVMPPYANLPDEDLGGLVAFITQGE